MKEESPLGNVFLKRGLAILSPDGPGQGETRNHMPTAMTTRLPARP